MFNTATEFSLYIEDLTKEKRLSHMDAILQYCTENYLEPDEIVPLISKSLRDKIENDFKEVGMLPKNATLE